jgi:hypothetical protein
MDSFSEVSAEIDAQVSGLEAADVKLLRFLIVEKL